MRLAHEVKAKLVKPCPFCGSKKIKALNRDYYEEQHFTGDMRLECEDCGATLWNFPHDGKDYDYNDAMKMIVERWNRRAS